MSLTYQLGISSSDAVTLFPNEDLGNRSRKILSEHRTKSGRLYSYTWARYRRIKFKVEYMPASTAAAVNSWWDTSAELLFFVTSDTATEVHSVMLRGKDEPLGNFSPPYVDKYKGTILLETY